MPDRILTSHAGSLPRPEELVALNLKRGLGELDDEAGYQAKLTPGGRRRRRPAARARDRPRQRRRVRPLDGPPLRLRPLVDVRVPAPRRARARRPTASSTSSRRRGSRASCRSRRFVERRDWLEFSDAYGDPELGRGAARTPTSGPAPPSAAGRSRTPATRRSQRDIANLKAALDAAGVQDGLHELRGAGELRAVRQRVLRERPGAHVRLRGRACARSTRRSSTPGSSLQLDDPAIAENWDQINPEPSRRGLPALHDAARRGAQPRDPRAAGGPDPLPPLLGQLARPARDRHPDGATSSTSC